MDTLARALENGLLAACNIGQSSQSRFQVSVRRVRGDGWEVFYGDDIEETIGRAIVDGPQSPPDEDDWSHLV